MHIPPAHQARFAYRASSLPIPAACPIITTTIRAPMLLSSRPTEDRHMLK